MSQHDQDERDRRYEERFERYRNALVALLKRLGRTKEEAEDIAQKILFEVWGRAEKIAQFAEWSFLKKAAYQRNKNFLRDDNAGVRGKTGAIPEKDILEHRTQSVEQRLIKDEEQRRFQERFNAVFRQLPSETRQILALRQRGKSSTEIGETLELHPTAVRSRLSRASERFREELGTPPPGVDWLEIPGENDDHRE